MCDCQDWNDKLLIVILHYHLELLTLLIGETPGRRPGTHRQIAEQLTLVNSVFQILFDLRNSHILKLSK